MRSLVTIGTFDGVHRGHQKLLAGVLRLARRLRLRATVVVFVAPPRFYFQPALKEPLITTGAERKRILLDMGVEEVHVLTFNRHWADMAHTAFFERFLLGRLRAGGLLVGRDFAFGKGRLGDIPWMSEACRARGMHFDILPLVRVGRRKVSSSRIRGLLLRGEAAEAAELLGRPYSLTGKVIHGQGLGAKIGVPTANLEVPPEKLAPQGVYKVLVNGTKELGEGRPGVLNIGTRPTVSGSARVHVEVHLPEFSGNLYGKTLTVRLLRRLRGEKKFPSLDALKAQIRRDIARASR